jgi:hypothetical protein
LLSISSVSGARCLPTVPCWAYCACRSLRSGTSSATPSPQRQTASSTATQPLFDAVLDAHADEFVRSCMCEALSYLGLTGQIERRRSCNFIRDCLASRSCAMARRVEHTYRHGTRKHTLAIFRHPNDVNLEVVPGVSARPISNEWGNSLAREREHHAPLLFGRSSTIPPLASLLRSAARV